MHSYSFPTIIIFILLAATAGCSVERMPDVGVRPVIEGWIDSDGYPVVIFTESLTPEEAGQQISDKVIRWGKVTISDGENTVIMTGGPSDKYFPPFRYYTTDMKGKPGHSYTVTAEYEGLYAQATCTMPPPTPIGHIALSPVEYNDTTRAATLYFTAPPDCPAYYCVTLRDIESCGRPLPAMMGTVIARTPGEEISLPLFNPKNSLAPDDEDYVAQFIVGHSIEVRLNRVTEEVYNFWNGYDNAVMFGGSQFVSTGSLRGNVTGGYGIWSTQGAAATIVKVE